MDFLEYIPNVPKNSFQHSYVKIVKQGEILKKAILLSSLKFKDIVKLSTISKSQFYNLYEMDVINTDYYPKLLLAGIDLEESLKSAAEDAHNKNLNKVKKFKDESSKSFDVSDIREREIFLNAVNQNTEALKVFTRIVDMAISQGVVIIDKDKKQIVI